MSAAHNLPMLIRADCRALTGLHHGISPLSCERRSLQYILWSADLLVRPQVFAGH